MPFHICSSLATKYSSLEYQKIHEHEYQKFLKTLQINKTNLMNISKEKLYKKNHSLCYYNNNYLFQRQINLQYRQDKRKILYEHIQKENLKFSQKLINAKAFLNRYEQKSFFDKHCKIKQQLQRYPDSIRIKTKKPNFQFSSNENFKIINKPVNSSLLVYNNNRNRLSYKSIKLQEKHSKESSSSIYKPQITEKKCIYSIKNNSKFSKTPPSITSTIQNAKKTSNITTIETNLLENESSLIPSTDNIINWKISSDMENLKQKTSSLKIQSSKTIYSSQSSSTSESNLSNL
ncbi:unnamed protein product [Rotaria sp. Silwood2]|nr:unnamed protein product [Rotaria sp. Silwood2]CAF3895271.1 unnamed protein product [Rotaria sp. Silwood2]